MHTHTCICHLSILKTSYWSMWSGSPRCITLPNFNKTAQMVAEILRFFKIAAVRYLGFVGHNLGQPTEKCTLNQAPTWLIKRLADVISPVISHLCSVSLQSRHLCGVQKVAIIHPHLKQLTLDACTPESYRPISNLSFLSKLLEL